jgi:hypothetical protein
MADIDVHYDPISVTSGPVTVDIKGLNDAKTKITLETPQPLKAETKSELAVTQPIKTESKFDITTSQPIKAENKAELDVKPLAIDQCLRLSLAPLPPTCLRFPSQQKLGLTLFGVEIVGLSYSGESQVLICEPAKDPHVVWGEVAASPHRKPEKREIAEEPAGGALRIRLGG